MTIEEFSNGFTTLLNSYAVNAVFGEQSNKAEIVLDEYEKSLFLTKAQEESVIALYSGRNDIGKGFEETEELREYLAPLVETQALDEASSSNPEPTSWSGHIKYKTDKAEGLWFIVQEQITVSGKKCKGDTSMDIYPITLDEYDKIKRNPFRGTTDRRALRIGPVGDVITIYSKYPVSDYTITYLRKPQPIILENLPDGLEIEGESEASEGCELPDSLHQRILELAVQMAIQSKMRGKRQEVRGER